MTQLYYYHWTNGHKQGYSPLPYAEAEIAALLVERCKVEPETVYELVPAEEAE